MKNYIFYFITAILLSGCNLFDYHPYSANVTTEKNLNSKAIAIIEEKCADQDTLRFIMMGDTQRWYDETELSVKHVNKRNDIDFVIHGGDISDFGMTKEFIWVHDIMSKMNVPYVAIIGNHDVIGNGLDVFKRMYGPLNFSFVAANIKFVCLNTNALEFDYSNPVPDFTFIKEEIEDSKNYASTIVAMHTPPFNEQFDNNVAEPFQYYMRQMNNLRFCLHAHTHTIMANDTFGDGTWYYGCDCMKGRNYYLFTVRPGGYEYEIVYF